MSDRSLVAAEHLVGNLWFNLDALPFIAARLSPDTMRLVVSGPSIVAYGEMCRLMRSPSDQLSAGLLESNLKAKNFDFAWLSTLQSRIAVEGISVLEGYANEINNAADLHRIRIACGKADRESQAEDARAEKIAADLLAEMTKAKDSARDVVHVSVAIDELDAELNEIRAGRTEWGARTGFSAIDKIVRMVDGDLFVIGGRPSQGKTSLAQQIAVNRAKRIIADGEDGQVVYFSADDSRKKLTMKIVTTEAQVDAKRLRENIATQEEWDKYERAKETIRSLPLRIYDDSYPTVESVYYRCAMLNAQSRIRLAILDYMELVKHPDPRAHDLAKVEHAASGLKGVGASLGFPFILLSQLRKNVEDRADKWPTASDLRYAGEAEADTVILIMRPEHYLARGDTCDYEPGDEEGVALLNIAKNKVDDVGRTRLAFVKKFSRFYDLERRELNGY